jgi:hypothetical protein
MILLDLKNSMSLMKYDRLLQKLTRYITCVVICTQVGPNYQCVLWNAPITNYRSYIQDKILGDFRQSANIQANKRAKIDQKPENNPQVLLINPGISDKLSPNYKATGHSGLILINLVNR